MGEVGGRDEGQPGGRRVDHEGATHGLSGRWGSLYRGGVGEAQCEAREGPTYTGKSSRAIGETPPKSRRPVSNWYLFNCSTTSWESELWLP